MIKSILSLAAASVAASSSLSTLPSLSLTPGPDIQQLASWTSKPIRTVVTVNSNRIDVLAAAEEDVPKVLEKLRELCAGPYANKYPEICEHLQDDDLWWPSVTSSILSCLSTLESLSASSIPAEPTPPLAEPSSSPTAESPTTILPSASPAPAEPIASIVTATTLVTTVVPTTISLTPSTITASPSTLELTVTQSIYGSHLTAPIQETVECPYSTADGENGETKPLCTVITIYHHLPIPTLITVTGPILSFPRDAPPGITLEPPQPKLPSRTRIRTTIVKTIEVVTDVPFDDSSPPDDDDNTPADDNDDDDQPPASIQFIQPTPLPAMITAHKPISEQPTFAAARRSAWSGYEPYPSVSWFMSADPPGGCTQTESIFRKITDFQTATVYAETVRATRVIGCECPNVMVVSVGGPGVVIEAVTTVTAVEGGVWTETGFACFTAFNPVGV
ncbi:hypothetical protein QBC40DRAFT_325622 [Triangularia verruculosa]|uniref:Uncharacterized protein n=1 Tax=Triangularia verruculosa TaxID=2587418 RepID=A0AAN6XR48_9PEZI|nr:hypothetical protein QBC40DRAFT_325622 [Triangularia verruculosa]